MCYIMLMQVYKKEVYMDYAASTPIDRRVFLAMSKISNLYANPHAIHKLGVKISSLIEISRKNIAKIIGAHSDEIIFTGNATESIALSVLGTVYHIYKNKKNFIPHIITTNIEHKAVLLNFKMLENMGIIEVTYLDVNQDGLIDLDVFKKSLKENTVFVSIGYANNEIGVVQDIEEVARIIRRYKKQNFFTQEGYPYLHTDATQAMNYLFTKNVEKIGIDMMSFNGSKIYGPKSIGILYKKRSVKIDPIYYGGGQEFGLRSGTENVQAVVGISKALEITEEIKASENIRILKLRDLFISKLAEVEKDTNFKITINGDIKNRLPNNINISIEGISCELLLIELDAKGVYLSTKSSCSSKEENSHVIRALRDKNLESLRFSLGRKTKERDVFYVINMLKKILLKYKIYYDINK